MKKLVYGLSVALLLATGVASAAARVYFAEPADGTTVSSPFKVRFGIDEMKLAPAGDMSASTGHHHLIVDGQAVPVNEVVASDPTHLHFGKMQTETTLTLPPGEHTLTLQFANGAHQSYGPELSQTIKVVVKP
jgi:hypothetical protein